MTVKALACSERFEEVCMPSPDEEVTGLYAGDLLSFVMGRAEAGDAWVTIMNNVNVIAVASLTGVACVIIAENSELSDDFVETANGKGVNVLRSAATTAQTCVKLGRLLGE